MNNDTSKWNARLLGVLTPHAARRKEVLDQTDKISAGLTIPIRRAASAPEIVPVKPRRAVVATAQAGAARAGEPELAHAVYEQIVETIRTVGNTAERLPATAAKFHEEEWRDLLLFILNANFEGAVQGEAFNGTGKTDLLLRFKDKNAFIGECKFWSGAKAFGDAIDQLLSYTVWRDSKAALILFIRNKNASSVIEKADAAIRDHACFITARPPAAPESRRDYLVRAKDDSERRISLAFLPIVVRTPVQSDERSTATQ